jgi:hypothetical protein
VTPLRTVLLAVLAAMATTGRSSTFVWTNTLGGNWSVALDWDPHGVPGALDIAKITTSGGYIVTNDQNTTVGGLILGSGVTGLQYFLVPPGKSLTATGTITVNGNGSVTVASGGVLNLTNSSALYLSGPGTNFGTINLTNTYIYLGNDETSTYRGGLDNQVGGQINLNGSGGIISSHGPDDYFFNHGLVTKTPGAGTSSLAASVGVLGGTYNAAAGTTVQFGGGTASSPLVGNSSSVTLNGPGSYQFTSGFLYYNGIPILSMALMGGILTLGPNFEGGSIAYLVLNGITLSNTLPISNSLWDGSEERRGLIVTNGTLTGMYSVEWNYYSGDTFMSVQGATVNAPVTVQSGQRLSINNAATLGNGVVTNAWLTVANGGFVDVAGVLTLNGPLTNSGTVNVTNGYNVTANNKGSAAYAGGIVNLPLGVINLWNNSSLYGFANGGEYLINQGTINKMSGTAQSTIDFSTFRNEGTLAPSQGTLLLQSSHFALQPSELLQVQLNSASDYGKFSVVGAASLTGTFGVVLGGGYVPPVGASFSVVSYGSLLTGFTGFNYAHLPGAGVWKGTYGSTTFSLVVQPGIVIGAAGTNVTVSANGPPNHPAIFVTSTNVAAPLATWTPLSTNTFDATGYLSVSNRIDPHQRQQFFGFELP